MLFRDMMVQIVPGEKGFIAIFAGVRQSSWEVNILHMLLQITSVCSSLSTQSAFETFRSKTCFLDKIGGEDNTGSTCHENSL